jgi:hypothetical protein
LKAEQEALEKAAEEEARLKAEQEAQEKAAEEEARLKAEQEAQEKAAEEEARLKAEQEVLEKAAEEEARLRSEQEAQEGGQIMWFPVQPQPVCDRTLYMRAEKQNMATLEVYLNAVVKLQSLARQAIAVKIVAMKISKLEEALTAANTRKAEVWVYLLID